THAYKKAERGCRGEPARSNVLQLSSHRPKVAKASVRGHRAVAHDDPEQDQPDERSGLCYGEHVLNKLSKLETSRVHPVEQSDHKQTKGLRRRKRDSVA